MGTSGGRRQPICDSKSRGFTHDANDDQVPRRAKFTQLRRASRVAEDHIVSCAHQSGAENFEAHLNFLMSPVGQQAVIALNARPAACARIAAMGQRNSQKWLKSA